MYSKMVKCVVFISFLILCVEVKSDQDHQPDENDVKEQVEQWSRQLGQELYHLSLTMTRKKKILESFKPLKDKIYYADGNQLIGEVACKLRYMMDKKLQAVGRIAEYAEFLSYHRKKEHIWPNGTFDYYNADNITKTDSEEKKVRELEDELGELKCIWWCDQKDLAPLPSNSFTKKEINDLFHNTHCDCEDPPYRAKPRRDYYYTELPLEKHPNFGDTKVNLNLSVVKVATNIYQRDQNVLQGVRWSEPLDLVFRSNWELDNTLKFQYFASPYGYMRHFPAIQWSDERYAMTYDPRTRSWYTEAMTSPKDIIILLDRSGSVYKRKRDIAAQIVNNILDTLNDNDFVNIYTFTNTTEPLVSCFTDTLVQANEENLRLLRESLDTYDSKYAANITIGLEKAFQILENFRLRQRGSSQCNQAIMVITEAVYYDSKKVFQQYNWKNDTPVRVFTYQLETEEEDARILEFMACSNKGYYVNVSLMEEIREKVLPYLNVMSRPVNLNVDQKQKTIWSYLYIDLADRRYTNWLWRKREGNRQREVFLDHAKREFMRLNTVLTSEKHFLLEESHEYEKYKTQQNYDYMTTVSLPVYGRREEDVDLIGVAGVDIPIKLLKSLVPHHILGVNGYAFIVTNNGYILMHPGHRREFENIPKPTFNRVDLLEVEILDDTNEPRLFGEEILQLREDIVNKQMGEVTLKIKYALDDMKRIILSKRKYFFTHLGPFKFGIALPDKYGLMIVNSTEVTYNDFGMGLLRTQNWSVHPDWVYCEHSSGDTPEEVVRNCLEARIEDNKTETPLFSSLLFDAKATIWFEEKIPNEERLVLGYLVDNVFLSTHSGLTRWKTFELPMENRRTYYEKGEREYLWGKNSIDEDWYKRAVDENFNNNKDDDMFIYSAPFETSGYEYDNLITSTNTIFVNVKGRKTPVAVVGLQFNYLTTNKLYKSISGNDTECYRKKKNRCYSCDTTYLTCFVLDNNAYIIFSDEAEYTGRYIGDIKPDIMSLLVQNRVYKETRMFDYQAICQKPPKAKSKNAASRIVFIYRKIIENLLQVTNWALATILFLVSSVIGGPQYESTKNETLAYERLEINKTVPTPCDQQMWLFTVNDTFYPVGYLNKTAGHQCPWAYIVERIPHSNLLFLAVNPKCQLESISSYKSPTPMEVTSYNETLACYIATQNKFARRSYMKCHTKHEFEKTLKENRSYCGHTWKP